MKKTIYILLGVVAISSCTRLREQQNTGSVHPVGVDIQVVGETCENGQHSYVGEIRPAAEYPVYYSLGGRLTKVHVRNGQQVTKGQAIADFDDTEASSLYQAAEAVLRQAEDAARRMQPLSEKGAITDVQWIDIQTNLTKARQSFRAAEKSLTDCHLTAPDNGIIAMENIHEGQHLRPGERIATLMDMHRTEAVFSVPEQDIRQITTGEQVTVEVPAVALTTQATISQYQLTANPLGHTYTVRATLTQGAKDALMAGMVCHIAVHHAAQAASVIVPGKALVTTPDGPAIWVVENGQAERRSIRVKGYRSNGIEVEEGLHPGDSVVVGGYQKLYSHAPVIVK